MAAKKKMNGGVKMGALPKGFVPLSSNLAGFFEREKGNSVTGILRGSFTTKGRYGERKVFRIEVTEGETQVGDGEVVGPGALIGLDETGYTKRLGDLDIGTSIFVRYEGKGDDQKDPHIFNIGRFEG